MKTIREGKESGYTTGESDYSLENTRELGERNSVHNSFKEGNYTGMCYFAISEGTKRRFEELRLQFVDAMTELEKVRAMLIGQHQICGDYRNEVLYL